MEQKPGCSESVYAQEGLDGEKKKKTKQLPKDNDGVHSMLIELQHSGDQTLAYTVGKLFTSPV